MTLDTIVSASASSIVIIIFLLLSMINVPKINLNLWGIIGKNLNKTVEKQIEKLSTRIDQLEKRVNENEKAAEVSRIERMRKRILEFSSDLLAGHIPTKEHEESVLEDIDKYEDYCLTHPEFPNSKAVLSIRQVKADYAARLVTKEFAENIDK